MKNPLLRTNLIIESALGLMTLLLIFLLAAGLVIVAVFPINNYHHATGVVEFKNQYYVTLPEEGIITEAIAGNYSSVTREQPLIRYRSENNDREVEVLSVRLKFLASELATMRHLFATGALNRPEVRRKELEIEEVATRKKNFEKSVIGAPVDGTVYYKILPEYIKGCFIGKGEVVALIYTGAEKHIRVSFPNTLADRFKIGGSVLFKYSDPVNFKIQRMKGIIYKTFINEKDKTVELFCDVVQGRQLLDLFQPYTMIDAAIVVNSTSICRDLFGIDPYPFFRPLFERFPGHDRWKTDHNPENYVP